MKFDDPTIVEAFDLDTILCDEDYMPPGPIANLVKGINRQQCCQVCVVLLNDGVFFLRWEERHPEMISHEDYWTSKGETAWLRSEEHDEYKQLLDVLPSRNFERPLTRRQAFALIAACWLPEEFAPEIESLARR